ncbi:hypothetical protein [Tardiphaga sp. vice278]|uniref:hypothetical protein n=1 Tax=Tardiphaga sp. vice278 TaxID=2592815 RepID=UPI0011643D6F|nr:hypothetical protein [Tardiphaga sp. vice278]QDM16846.1 hypothetical protein FNL53_13575 [Tardiphaga sp. vice278]
MIKKFALVVAAAILLYVATPAAPAAAQGISVQLGGGGGYGHRDRGYRDRGYRGRDYRRGPPPRHWDRGYHRGQRGRTIIVR